MSYELDGKTIEADANGYLVDMNAWTEELGEVIAKTHNIDLDEKAWDVVNFLRDAYINENGEQPNDRNIIKAMTKKWGEKIGQKDLYKYFPKGPSKQAAMVGGLPESRRKGGY